MSFHEYVPCPCGGRREHNLATGDLGPCDTCDHDPSTASLVEELREFNRVAAPYLRQLPTERFNALIWAFERGDVILGGDSACFHLQPVVCYFINGNSIDEVVDLFDVDVHRDGAVTDCNPWLDEEMVAGKYMTVADVRVDTPSPSALTPQMRKLLEWSWDYGVAEAMMDETTRHLAMWVAHGVENGQKQTDGDLIADFLKLRVSDLDNISAPLSGNWDPTPGEQGFTWAELLSAMVTHRDWVNILLSLQSGRDDDEEE